MEPLADAECEILVDDGVATIRGWARPQATVDLVPQVVSKVDGVKEVHGELALGRGV